MKKTALFALAACLLFLMASCSAAPKSEPFDAQTFLKDITPNVSCLDSCVQEVFGAQADMDTVYLAAYESESAYAGGTGNIALLFKQGEEGKYTGYYIDPAYTSYYPVTNFKTNAEVADYLKKYLSQDIIDQWFSNDFLEYEGTLYLVRGARGYGAMTCDLGSLQYLEEKDGKQYVTVKFNQFDAFDHTEKLQFTKVNGSWVMTGEEILAN